MASITQIDKLVQLYKQLYRIPSLAGAKLIIDNKNCIRVQSVWSQRNLERLSKQTFLQEITFNSNLQPLVNDGFPIDVTSELLRDTSEDQSLKAILRGVTIEGKTKQFIEIWDKKHLTKSFDLSAFDVHGDVYTDIDFKAFQLSPDNTKLLYVAEKKLPKCEPFYKQKPKKKSAFENEKSKNDDEEPIKGAEYDYKPDWGEKLVGKHRSVIAILNIVDESINVLTNIPDDYFPAQVLWAPNGIDVIGIAYKLSFQYLGLKVCTNRESYIFHLKETEFRKYNST